MILATAKECGRHPGIDGLRFSPGEPVNVELARNPHTRELGAYVWSANENIGDPPDFRAAVFYPLYRLADIIADARVPVDPLVSATSGEDKRDFWGHAQKRDRKKIYQYIKKRSAEIMARAGIIDNEC